MCPSRVEVPGPCVCSLTPIMGLGVVWGTLTTNANVASYVWLESTNDRVVCHGFVEVWQTFGQAGSSRDVIIDFQVPLCF